MTQKMLKKSTGFFPWGVMVLAGLVLLLLGGAVGMSIGKQQAVRAVVPEGEGVVKNKGDIPDHLSKDVDFQQFWNVWNLVKETHIKQPVSDVSLYYGALKGMVAAAGDPYTTYFDPSEAQAFTESLEGSFSGIGAEIGIREDRLRIIAPLPETPAEKAGLQPMDWIVKIDDTETTDMTVEEAVTRIRGEQGTPVVLTVAREGLPELVEVTIERDVITIDSVRWEIGEDNIATISIFTFNNDTTVLFQQAVSEVLEQDADGIILDLRSNPGGLLTSAIEVASAWIGRQPVVIENTLRGQEQFKGNTTARLDGVPTVVLVNGGSASGSEIVAGALQDYGLATLVGTQTFGKGSVQDYRELSDGSAVKVTVAEWLTPNGRSINESGITPDIEVDVTAEDLENEHDPQKEEATRLLQAGEAAPAQTAQAE